MFFLQIEGIFQLAMLDFGDFFKLFERVLVVGKPIRSMGLVALKSNLP